MTVLTTGSRTFQNRDAQAGVVTPQQLLHRIQAGLSNTLRSPALGALNVCSKLAQPITWGGALSNSLKYWTGWHQTEMKASEWLVVLIGVAAGAVILYVSSTPAPLAATFVPQPRPTPISSVPETREGQEWDCLIVEDSQDLVNLVCEKGADSASHLARVEPVSNAP